MDLKLIFIAGFSLILLTVFFSFNSATKTTLLQDINKTVYGADINGFLDLNDTPGSYVGQALLCVAVKGTEDGLEFVVCGTGTFTDTNFATFSDFNKAYVSWFDGNLTYWKQVDLNALLQLYDFNSMIINLGEGQGWNASGTDTNWQTSWTIFDANNHAYYVARNDWTSIDSYPSGCPVGQFVIQIGDTLNCATPSYTIDTNWQTSFYLLDQNLSLVYAKILDVNSADALRLLLTDLNNFSGINYSAIADINAIITHLAESLNWQLDTNCSVQGSCSLIAYVTDVNQSISDLNAGIQDINSTLINDVNNWITQTEETGMPDGNFFSLFNLVDTNLSLTYYRQDNNTALDNRYLNEIDRNSVASLAWTAINKVGSSIADLATKNFSDIDSRLFSLLSLDNNASFDARYNLITDTNNLNRILASAVYFVGATLTGLTSINVFDLNIGNGFIQSNDLEYSLQDLNYSVNSQCSGDTNSVLTSAGNCQDITDFHLSGGGSGTGIDTNIFVSGQYSNDSNSFLIDINAGGNSVINVNDLNTQHINIRTGDLNFTINDKNIIMQTANGTIIIQPDFNRMIIGQANGVQAYQQLVCGTTGDCNYITGFI